MQRDWLADELNHAMELGIAVVVEGVPYEQCEPEVVWEMMQRGNYMMDYEGDATGRIIALHIDLVGPWTKDKPKKRCK